MSEGTPITREGVEFAYRTLLGRPPESEKAIAYGLSAGTLETLRRWILDGPEFAKRLQRDAPHVLRRSVLREMQAANPDSVAPEADGPPRIVFLHIMKTAGSSIRDRLEEIAAGEPIWRRDVLGRPGDFPQPELAKYRVVMGHFNIIDARHVPHPRRIFTVLRDPRDRLISYYYFLHRHRAEFVEARGMERARIARQCTLEEFLQRTDTGVQDGLHNVMTRTLAGDYRSVGRDRYARPGETQQEAISGPALLTLALTNLFSLDFFTFVDRLEEDRPRLMQVLGVPDLGPLPQSNTRDMVSDNLEQRPPPVVTPLAEKLLTRLTDLDRLLYRLARQHIGM